MNLTKLQALVFYCFLISIHSISQQNLVPVVWEYEAGIQKINALNNNFHEGVKPYNYSELKSIINIDTIDNSRTFFKRKQKIQKNTSISILPLLNAATGFEKSSNSVILYNTGIGALLDVGYKNKLHFKAYYQTDLQKAPTFINDYVENNSVMPQEGIAYHIGNAIYTRNFGAYLSYSPSEIFNLQIGHGKNHFGNGYRSLLLSDASNNYLYGKITTTIWKFKYVNLYTNFKDIGTTNTLPYWQYNNKFGTFHYLSWNITKRINMSFFESIIWQGKDTLVNRSFDVNYLNPVIFYRPVEYSVGSSDNSLMGANLRYKLSNYIQLYGQLIMDEFLLKEVRSDIIVVANKIIGKEIDPNTKYGWWANKQGFQIGAKWYNIFKIENLNILAEYNTVRPYTYTHISGESNYGHYNQALAHLYGANFKEGILLLNYQKNNWNISLQNIYAVRGIDDATNNYGGNIFKPYITREQEYYNYTTQGITSKMLYTNFKISYILNPKNMLHAFVGFTNRIENTSGNSTFIYLGIKTSLYNSYLDF